ncbi:hypothetical protein [Microbacterium album]|uniref:Uncharacterized protein n=1 Tax=Microbacterium album TaxID=2053191 RepID=A0A917IGF5_9MICO|nr:hypothetical protein [Microbacterium album]GGH47983.1 hypothetical protein GCM10010921_25120 [Microbacterium album]
MSSDPLRGRVPVIGGERTPLARAVGGIASFTVPPVAWLGSLGLSYVIEDFTCAAVASAAAPVPDAALQVLLLVLNAVLLIVCLAAGALGVVLARRDDEERNTIAFLGWTGVASAALFGFGIVLIGIHPLLLGICS